MRYRVHGMIVGGLAVLAAASGLLACDGRISPDVPLEANHPTAPDHSGVNGATPAHESRGADATPNDAATEAVKQTLAGQLSRSSNGLPAVRTPSGSTRIDLQGRFSSVSILQKMPDGTHRKFCATSMAELEARLAEGKGAR